MAMDLLIQDSPTTSSLVKKQLGDRMAMDLLTQDSPVRITDVTSHSVNHSRNGEGLIDTGLARLLCLIIGLLFTFVPCATIVAN